MDLLQSVRKEGSRGGVNFTWDDVKSSQHRENYLGHSLMAPVGRWQKGKDLGWYAKADDAELTPEERAEKEREIKREEIRKVKEAEEHAMALALGLPVPDRSNANNEPLGEEKIGQKDANKALEEALSGDEDKTGRGVVFGAVEPRGRETRKEVMKGSRLDHEKRYRSRSREKQRGHEDDRSGRHRRRNRSRSRDGRDSRERRHRRHHRSRSRSRDRKHRSRSRDHYLDDRYKRRREDDHNRTRSRDRMRRRGRSRSTSPHKDRRKTWNER